MAARVSEQQAAGERPSGSPKGEKRLNRKLKGFRRGRACFSLRAANQPPWAAAGCSHLLSALLRTPPPPSSAPGTRGRKGITVTSILHSAPKQGTLQAQNIRSSHAGKKRVCLAKAVHSLLESQVLHVGRVQRSSPSLTGRPVPPSLVAPRGARP